MVRRLGFALAAAAVLAGCVSTKQYADVEFAPPQGHYRLLVMRPDISVGSVTTGGLVEQRADWTEAARSQVLAALRAQQAARGGDVLVMDKRNALPGVDPDRIAELERLHYAVGSSIVLHRYSGAYLPTKRRQGLDWTLGEDAVALGRDTGFDYALFLHAEDSFVSDGRVALQILGIAGCFVGFCAPNVGGGGQLAYASLINLKTGEVVWFNVVQAGSQVAGIKFGDMRTAEGAQQLIDRLLGRMKPGRAVREQGDKAK